MSAQVHFEIMFRGLFQAINIVAFQILSSSFTLSFYGK